MIYFLIWLIPAILLIIITNNLVYIDLQRNFGYFFENDDYIIVTIYSLTWPMLILGIIITFGLQFIWNCILFPILIIPGRIYFKYKRK